LTRIQQLERDKKDLKAQLKTVDNQVKILTEFVDEQRKAYDLKIESLNKRIDLLYTDLCKANTKIKELEEENKKLREKETRRVKEIDELNLTINKLTARIKKDSSNSSKPSSTDGFKKKVHNHRKKTGRKPGGQPGHKGNSLKLFADPTQIIKCKKEHCKCGGNIVYKSECVSKKQHVDIEIIVKITEFQTFEGACDYCGKQYTSKFPEDIINTVNYGDNLKAVIAMLTNEGMVSIKRTVEIVSSLTNSRINVSEGTVVNINYDLAKNCEPLISEIKSDLIKANVLCVDESGVRINGKLNWIHTACTDDTTLYMIDKKRGTEATDNMGILAYFVGVLMHDHLKSYYNYKTMDHAECNAHILRYLKGIIEIFKRKEAEELLSFLVKVNNEKKQAIKEGRMSFSEVEIKKIENEYLEILDKWEHKYKQEVENLKETKYHNDERCLIARLIEYKEEHLRFVKDFAVPFDNNAAERALRMIKTKIKVSGGFRSENGSSSFATIRSIISTAKKRGLSAYQIIRKIIRGETVALA